MPGLRTSVSPAFVVGAAMVPAMDVPGLIVIVAAPAGPASASSASNSNTPADPGCFLCSIVFPHGSPLSNAIHEPHPSELAYTPFSVPA
jgi:hypothetical protein